jgi:hypothetical protein
MFKDFQQIKIRNHQNYLNYCEAGLKLNASLLFYLNKSRLESLL